MQFDGILLTTIYTLLLFQLKVQTPCATLQIYEPTTISICVYIESGKKND
ncbi:hypothetical protein GLYMA_17G239601v4 [Glycine max]|nr:hypothetical protein GLYMA_17G239601v4 [Glycine max]KAH1119891.1 hypothetical protein GYH30_048312 [Glycine max]